MKIITISDSPTLFSGLARVHRHVLDGLLEQGHEVLCCGWFAYDEGQMEDIKEGRKVDPVYYEGPAGKTRVMCVPKKNGTRDMCAIYDVIDHVRPDAVVTIGDFWDFWYMRAIKIKAGFSFDWVPYLTIEHEDIEEKWVRLLGYADEILVPSRFGKEALDSSLQRESVFCPYGTEDVFQRPSNRRRKALRRARGCDGKVRFITVAQNTFRKNLPALIQAAKLVAHRDPQRKMQFYIHTNVDHGAREEYLYDLRGLVDKLGVSDRFVFPCDDETFSVFDSPGDTYMADEYGASDFFVLPSTCEGYGLPMCEAMACGVPAIANCFSTIPEHLGAPPGQGHGRAPRGWLVGNRAEVHPPSRMLRVVRPDALGQSIWEAFLMATDQRGRGRLEGMRERCEEYGKGRTWENMKKVLCDILPRMAGKTRIPVEEL